MNYDKPAKVTTEWCKAKLTATFTNTKESGWRRVSKKNDAQGVLRLFAYDDGRQVNVLETASEVIITEAGTEPTTESIKAALKQAGKSIRHCGDYSHIYYNAKKKQVFWCGGDADGEVLNGHTDLKEVKRLLKLPGVRSVQVEAECSPDEEDGWEDLGRCGIEFNPDYGLSPSNPSHAEKQNGERTTQLKPGFLLVKFADYYSWNNLVHVRETSPGQHAVYSFGDQKVFQYGKTTTGPVIESVSEIKEPLGPEFDAAIADIYQYLKKNP